MAVMKVWINGQWVTVGGGGGTGTGLATVSTGPPDNPQVGEFWYDTDEPFSQEGIAFEVRIPMVTTEVTF